MTPPSSQQAAQPTGRESADGPTLKVAVLALPECLASSVVLPLEMLSAAAGFARLAHRQDRPLAFTIAGEREGPITTHNGIVLMADQRFDQINSTDLLILPALWRNPLPALRRHAELLPWLQRLAAKGTLICACGTSSFFLAEAGLLNGRAATTHWYFCDLFAERYPQVQLKRQFLLTQAQNLYCAGSVNSIADLMIHLAAQFFGQRVARQVEAQFSPEIRRPFENHAYAQNTTQIHQDEAIITAQEWLREQLATTVVFPDLARDLGMTVRTFNRRFRAATGVTPGAYLQSLRINNARELLRTSNLTVAEIAERCGFQDSSYFSRSFRAEMGQTPLHYRQAAKGKLFKVM